MARAKQPARQLRKGITTWTRFYLPLDQEWPAWPVDHEDVHVGPLASVVGAGGISLGRMVEDPEQAAYIIVWTTLEDLENFQSSPACIEFLQNLREHDPAQVSIEPGSALRRLTLDDASPSSSSRFLTLKHVKESPTADVEGRVTLTAFSMPAADESTERSWHDKVREAFRFFPRGSESIRLHRNFVWQHYTVWFLVTGEDGWVRDNFVSVEGGKAQQEQGRTILCEFRLWPSWMDVTLELEEALAKDPQAKASWEEAAAKVMPPVTAWEQERWDIRKIPRFEPPVEPEEDELMQELDT
ncbi:hypothetical protein HD806DRAFT_515834 [Xylariaceae sp. AK1471]|nr:hypothetical protein HD806DRAFT_515834 [Xylariaceae sp. AK1471]